MFHQSSTAGLLRVAAFGAALVVPGATAFAADVTAPNAYATVEHPGSIPYAVSVVARPIFGQPRQALTQPAALPGQVSQLASPYDGSEFAVPANDIY
ncbi:MAG TPA: hypothetical protein VNF99_19100 [Stellaceae bacterium]|nr:hypothetical protein [Stellaceae bacterium]